MMEAEQKMWLVLAVATRRRNTAFAVKNRSVRMLGALRMTRRERRAIEIDGGQHAEQGGVAIPAQPISERRGHRVLRFWNNDDP